MGPTGGASVGWFTLCNVSSAVARQFCRIFSGLSIVMPSEVSKIGDDQSVEKLERELAESRDQQVATAEILRVISSSSTDPERVFAEIAASAARLCESYAWKLVTARIGRAAYRGVA